LDTAGGAAATTCARAFAVFSVLSIRLLNSLLPASFCAEVDFRISIVMLIVGWIIGLLFPCIT
jgi:hypothetical protein